MSGNVPAGQCTGTPRRARAAVELLRQETPNFLTPKLWPPNSPYLIPVDYEICPPPAPPLPSYRRHLSYGDCIEGKGEDQMVC